MPNTIDEVLAKEDGPQHEDDFQQTQGPARKLWTTAPINAPNGETIPETGTKIPEAGVEQPKQKFTATEEYQLEDETGKAIGPPQKFTAESEIDQLDAEKKLRAMLVTAHKNSSKKLKEYKDKYRTLDKTTILPKFEPKVLSAEQKVRLARKMQDPQTLEEGFEELFTARTGVSPEQYRAKQVQEQYDSTLYNAQQETQRFNDSHPEFPPTAEARKLMIDTMAAKNEAALAEQGITEYDKKNPPIAIEWNEHNLTTIYDELVEAGRLTPTTSKSQEETPKGEVTPVAVQPTVAITPADATTRTRPRGTRHSSMMPSHSSVSQGMKQSQDDAAFLEGVRKLSPALLKQKIKTDRAFAQRLDQISLARK